MWVTDEQKKAAKAVTFQTALAALGVPFCKVTNGQLLYYSPFTDERTASCLVEPKKNLINDFSSGFSGDIIKFAMQVRGKGFQDAVLWLISLDNSIIEFKKEVYYKDSKITLTDVKPLTSDRLLSYVYNRGVSRFLADTYLKQIHYRVGQNNFVSIGFQNDNGGYELRSPPKTPNDKGFKGCLGTKHIRTVSFARTDKLAVFEGFFSFLSYLRLGLHADHYQADYIILNSLNTLKKVSFDKYKQMWLYLDNDAAGIRATQKIIEENPLKTVLDCSKLYKGFNDLNEYLVSKL
ncbi:toprim domain-containing protein [Emticicia soli]|uniref:Toprim domain-containing protein n=1 Tax=Emticicia soli TaxID=2027878 RepID=A0ABW5J8C1_9BACT